MLYYSPEVAKGLWKTNGVTDPELREPRAAAAQVEPHHPCPFTAGLHSQSAIYTAEINQDPVATL